MRVWSRLAPVLALSAGLGLGAVDHLSRGVAHARGGATPVPPSPRASLGRPAPAPDAPSPAPGLGAPFRGGRVIDGSTPHRLILFTFDDGPDHHHTPRLLDALDQEGVKAVFFLTARRIEGTTRRQRQQAEIAREIVRRGHLVGSHTLDHLQLPTLNNVEVRAQIRDAERIFERVLGGRPWLLRPPGGARSARVDGLIAERGYTTMMWNLGSGDVQVETPEAVLETWQRVFDRREREEGDGGGIVLLHDIHERSVEAFQLILDDLRARNCRLLSRGEELYDVVDDPAPFFVPRADGDPATAPAGPALPAPEWIAARQAQLRVETRRRCAPR